MMEKTAWGRQGRRDLPIWEKQIDQCYPYRWPVIVSETDTTNYTID